MNKESSESFETIQDPGEAGDQIFAVESVNVAVPCLNGLRSPGPRPFVMEQIESSGEFAGRHGTSLCGKLKEAPSARPRDLSWDPGKSGKEVESAVLT